LSCGATDRIAEEEQYPNPKWCAANLQAECK
jgi:hypothetical protein